MFDIQPNKRFKLRSYTTIKELAVEQAHGSFGKWGASTYITRLKKEVPDGVVTIKAMPCNTGKIRIHEGDDLFIKEWMIKEHIAE